MTIDSRSSQQFAPLLRRPVIETLAAASGPIPCHLVGGILRDFLLDAPSRDLDVIVERDGQRVAEKLATELGARLVLLGGDRFAAFRIVATELVVDLWDRERQSLTADLARRDFTVNSFALALQDAEVVDPHSGIEDLAARRLRATTEHSFSGDPLRVLRLARFGGQLDGFTVVLQTLELARQAVPALRTVAPERIREELNLLFGSESCEKSFTLLEQLGVYPALWTGELSAPLESTTTRAALERLERSSRWLEQMAPDPLVRRDPVSGRMAVLFDAASRARHRPKLDLLEDFQASGYLSKREAQRISRLLRWQDLPREEGRQRWLLHEMGELWPTLVCYLGAQGEEPMDEAEWEQIATGLSRLAAERGSEIFAPAPLLTGTEIQELVDIPPGPRVGEIATKLRRLQIEGRISSRSAAERAILAWGPASDDPNAED